MRRLTPRRAAAGHYDDWTDSEADAGPQRTSVLRPAAGPATEPRPARSIEAVPDPNAVPRPPRRCRAASTTPSRSPTASRRAMPVILNLQSADQELSKRLIDFASGLTYALDGGMQRVADKVFLLTPRNVEVSRRGARAAARARLLQPGVALREETARRKANAQRRWAYAATVDLARATRSRGPELPERLRDRLHARDLRVHDHELAAAAVLDLAEPDPALPLRRQRAVPAALPAHPARCGAARPVADGRRDRPLGRRAGCSSGSSNDFTRGENRWHSHPSRSGT